MNVCTQPPPCESGSRQPGVKSVLWTLAASASVVALVAGTIESLEGSVRAETQHKVLETTNVALDALRAQEDAKLSGYGWVDRAHGVLRVPLARARTITLTAYASARADAGPASPPPPSRSAP